MLGKLTIAGFFLATLSAATPEKVPLTTIDQVHGLSSVAAHQKMPVIVRGTVTQYMPEWNGFSMQDKTGAVYVSGAAVSHVHLRAGERVEVRGTTDSGNYAPIVMAGEVKILGSGDLPKPRPADWQFLSSGSCDNDYVSVTGVVRSVIEVGPPRWRWHAMAIHVDLGGNLLWAYARTAGKFDFSDLPDDTVRISGTCLVLANSRKRFEGTSLLISDPSRGIRVLDAVSAPAESVPLTPIGRMFVFNRGSEWQRRVRVRGVVTWAEGDRLTIQSQDDGLLVRTVSPISVRPGQVVDAVGFPTAGSYAAELDDAVIVQQGRTADVAPELVKPRELVPRFHDARPQLPDALLVRMQGTVVGVSHSTAGEVLALQDGPIVFNARLGESGRRQERAHWTEGSTVSVTGICLIQPDDLGMPQSFELALRSRADVKLVRRPDWLTRSLLLQAAGILLAVALIAILIVIVLGRRVGVQKSFIEQQRKREAELGKRMRQLVENANDLVYILDTQGRILHLNFGAERLTGYSRTEQLGRQLPDFLVPEERDLFREMLSRDSGIVATGDSTFEQSDWTFLRKDGVRVTLELNQRFVTGEDGQIRVEVIGRDVTARKQAVLDNAERFRALADNIPQLAWMADKTGAIVWFNQRWFDYTGSTLAEARGWGWEKWHHPEHVERVATRLRECFAEGEEWQDTFPLLGKDGQFRWFLGRATPIHDAAGEVVRWFGTNTDITEQKQIETELQHSNEDLQQFAYIASHDLQEPIRNVIIYSQLLSRTFSNGDLTPKRSMYLDVVIGGAKRLEALIMGLLAYSRVSATDRMESPTIAVESAVQTALESLRSAIEETGAQVSYADLPYVAASPIHVSQVFQNLISNAIKYRRAEVPPVVSISARKQVDRWLFSVQDNGRGFEPQYAETVFGIFKRLHGADVPGTGIGLAICRAIIERHGGDIWAEGKAGEGATFWFTLPAPPQRD